MMFKSARRFVGGYLIVILLLGSVIIPYQTALALAERPLYALVYGSLYPYGETNSEVLNLYHILRTEGFDALLLSSDEMNNVEIPKGASIVVVESSFASQAGYGKVIQKFSGKKIIFYNKNMMFWQPYKSSSNAMICIDKVFPFSDLNKLMDTAEFLHNRGVEFICTLMPVYENTNLPEFDKYIEVLSYVKSKGGQFFIHFPVFNSDGTYGANLKESFSAALGFYREMGLEIDGITLSQDQLFSNDRIFEGLNLPVVLVSPPEKKLNSDISYYEVSEETNKYVYFSKMDINDVNLFDWKETSFSPKQNIISINSMNDTSSLSTLLDRLKGLTIPVMEFRLSDYYDRYKDYDYTTSHEIVTSNKEKSELELFKEKEMEKIRNENAKPEPKINNYDISGMLRSVILVIFSIILILGVQLFVGRKLDIKKIFRK